MLTKSDMHPYQVGAVKHIIKNRHCALFMEMGLGKTVCSLTAINTLMYEELEIDKVLVIAPKRVAEHVWEAECNNWEHLRHLKLSKVIGTAKKRRLALQAKADIYLMGRDNVAWLCSQYGGSYLPFDMLIIDELSSFKNHGSLRFKALRNTQPSFKRVVGLTGTPAPNSLIDLWSQMYLLDKGERLEKFVTRYRQKYFHSGSSNGHIVYRYDLNQGAEKEIHNRIKDICLSMESKDYLNLPERIENIVKIPFPDKLQAEYDEFEKEKIMEIFAPEGEEDVEITAVNAGALANKLLQFANGAVYDEAKNWHEVHDLKLEAAKEIIENANSPVLIGWTYRHDMYRLMEYLKKYKPVNLKDAADIDRWNAGEIQVMMMHPASGGHGLNLQSGGNNIIWFGQTWSLELEQQFNARLYRQGQDRPVIINKLVCTKTHDVHVIRAQRRKASGQKGLMEAVKARISKYIQL